MHMPDRDFVPSDIVKQMMDISDKATAKELSDLEGAVTSLITKIGATPTIADIHKIVVDIQCAVTDMGKSIGEMSKKHTEFYDRLKWLWGIVIIVVGIAVGFVSYITTIHKSKLDLEAIQKIEILKQEQEKVFKALLDELKNLKK
jgi:hypothetical protein